MNDARLEFEVLQREDDIEAARSELVRSGLMPLPSLPIRVRSTAFRTLRLRDPGAHRRPDPVKSWDVLRTIEAISAHVGREEPVLDVGSIASAIPPALARLGYMRLSGIDLNPEVTKMGDNLPVDYRVGDLTATDWPDGSFAAINATSVIEHGVPEEALLREVSRLLRPGGLFFFSTDYWPDKIDTSDTQLFGVPWSIFSAEEIEAFVVRARGYGLTTGSEVGPALRRVADRPIRFAGRSYTFLYGVLVKDAPPGSS